MKPCRPHRTRGFIVIAPTCVGACSREPRTMAVVVRKRMLVGGVEVDLKTYQPGGRLGKRERERADDLDRALAVLIPRMPDVVAQIVGAEDGVVRKWYVLGQKIREFVHDQASVSATDV